MMIEVNTVVLENGIEYTEVDEITYNNNKYILLSNIKNVKDSCIRRLSIEDDNEYLCRLDNDQEYYTFLILFIEKNKALF